MTTTYFHGGRPGFSLGDVIRPPCETNTESLHDVLRDHDPMLFRIVTDHPGGRTYRGDRVYVAADLELALVFACLYTLTPWLDGYGSVYAVRPEGRMNRDPAVNGSAARSNLAGPR